MLMEEKKRSLPGVKQQAQIHCRKAMSDRLSNLLRKPRPDITQPKQCFFDVE